MQNKSNSLGKAVSNVQRKLVFISRQWKRNTQQTKITFFQSTLSFPPPSLPECIHSPNTISSKSSQISSQYFIIFLLYPCPLFFNRLSRIALGETDGRELMCGMTKTISAFYFNSIHHSPLQISLNLLLHFNFIFTMVCNQEVVAKPSKKKCRLCRA